MIERPVSPDSSLKTEIENFIKRINAHEPIQHVLGECEFYGRTFKVTRDVLIPRPETEELVNVVKKFCTDQKSDPTILDVGTGSGCIAITLALEISPSKIYATDVSNEALLIAKENARLLKAPVQFYLHNILQEELPVNELSVVVSNPPYVTFQEKKTMRDNVLLFEPHLALFVNDDDPLLFYRSIVSKSKTALRKEGLLVVEINENFGKEVQEVFKEHGFISVEIIKDIFGKERIVRGIKK